MLVRMGGACWREVTPSALAFALNTVGSILNATGLALRDLAGRGQQDRGGHLGARLRPGTEWAGTTIPGLQ